MLLINAFLLLVDSFFDYMFVSEEDSNMPIF